MSAFPTLDDARRLADLGLRPLWLWPPYAHGHGAGKQPVEDGWESFRYLPPNDVAGPPITGCNLGVMTGSVSGAPVQIAAVGIDGPEVQAVVDHELGASPVRVQTVRGVTHFYRLRPDTVIPRGSRLRAAPLDVFGDKSQVVVAPSVHKLGHIYSEMEPWTPILFASMPFLNPDKIALEGALLLAGDLEEFLRNFPTSLPACLWLGNLVGLIASGAVPQFRVALDGDSKRSFDGGVEIAKSGAKITRPADISRDIASQVKKLCAVVDVMPDQSTPFSIQRLVRHVRRHNERSTFDVTLMQGNAIVTVAALTGEEVFTWHVIHARALEGRMVLPMVAKKSQPRWADMLARAMLGCEDVLDDVEADAASSLTETIKTLVNGLAEGETKNDLERGRRIHVRGEICVHPAWMVRQIRVTMSADRLERKDIVAAVRRCGGAEKQVLLKDNSRPRVWAFPEE